MPFTRRDQKDKLIDHIIKKIPADKDRYCIKHKKDTNIFQKDKDRLFKLSFNTEKSNNAEIAELKCMKNSAVKMLNDFGEIW